jgi:hypothetical protein
MNINTTASVATMLTVLSGAVYAQTTRKVESPLRAPPQFKDFRVRTPIPARKEPAQVANHVSDFEKLLRETAKEGPNFAGHFVVEEWSCGSFCTGLAIVDSETTKLHYVTFNVSYFCPEHDGGSALEYELDSRLLIARGAIETYSTNSFVDGPCGRFYYKWDGHSLKLIHSVVPVATSRSKSSNVRN